MMKQVLNTDISSIELKVGQVVQLRKTTDKKPTVHNMVIIPMGEGKLGAIEELFSTDTIITDWSTGANYCYINREKYPDTLGINPVFGDELMMVYPHLDYCKDDEEVIEITYYNKDGVYCTRSVI